MKLETQIDKLAELGLPLNEGITVDDFLTSWSRSEYEDQPFDTILFTYGIEVEEEPWGRFFCDRVWNFDAECIYGDGDYSAIVQAFHRISGKKRSLEDLSDEVDPESGKATLRFTLDGQPCEFLPRIDNDWVDPHVAEAIMQSMRSEGHDFYGKDNGQATVWFYMTPQNAILLNELAGNVFGLSKRPWWKVW
ncbi:MAG: hypothetical protein AAGI48_08535 [Verrucomicrobiota bacterium]